MTVFTTPRRLWAALAAVALVALGVLLWNLPLRSAQYDKTPATPTHTVD